MYCELFDIAIGLQVIQPYLTLCKIIQTHTQGLLDVRSAKYNKKALLKGLFYIPFLKNYFLLSVGEALK
jgi:hypothetical protein